MKVITWTVMASVCTLALSACDEQKKADEQPAAKLAASATKAEEPTPPAEPVATAKPQPEKLAGQKVTSDKNGVEFELPAALAKRESSDDQVLAWNDDRTVFFAAGPVATVEQADKDLEALAKALDLTLVKHDAWKDDEHNGMKAKVAPGELKTAKGEEVKGHVAVMTTAEGKNVGFLILYLASKEAEHKGQVEDLEESIKPIGKT